MHITLKNNIVYYYQNPAGYLHSNKLVVDSDFECDDILNVAENKGFNLTYENGIFQSLVSNKDSFNIENTVKLKSVRIWQLKDTFDVDSRFKPYNEMIKKHKNLSIEDYKLVFTARFSTNNLEEIFELCNQNSLLTNEGHPLSISDIIELYDEDESGFFYVDKFGFQKVEF